MTYDQKLAQLFYDRYDFYRTRAASIRNELDHVVCNDENMPYIYEKQHEQLRLEGKAEAYLNAGKEVELHITEKQLARSK